MRQEVQQELHKIRRQTTRETIESSSLINTFKTTLTHVLKSLYATPTQLPTILQELRHLTQIQRDTENLDAIIAIFHQIGRAHV